MHGAQHCSFKKISRRRYKMKQKTRNFLGNLIPVIAFGIMISVFTLILINTDFEDIGASKDHFVIEQYNNEDDRMHRMHVGYHFGSPFVATIMKIDDEVKIINPHGSKSFLRIYKIHEGNEIGYTANGWYNVVEPNWDHEVCLGDIHDYGVLTGNYYRVETYMSDDPGNPIISRDLVLID